MKSMFLKSLALSVCLAGSVYAQEHGPAKTASPAAPATTAAAPPAVVITAESPAVELAKAAFTAQGGEKFRAVQNMMLRGSVSLYPPNSPQSIPGAFSIVTANDKLRLEIDARPIIVFKQIYDGQQSYSSMAGVEVPVRGRSGRCADTGRDEALEYRAACHDGHASCGQRLPAFGIIRVFRAPGRGDWIGSEGDGP